MWLNCNNEGFEKEFGIHVSVKRVKRFRCSVHKLDVFENRNIKTKFAFNIVHIRLVLFSKQQKR